MNNKLYFINIAYLINHGNYQSDFTRFIVNNIAIVYKAYVILSE